MYVRALLRHRRFRRETGILAGSLLAGLMLGAAPLPAQQVAAEVVIRDGRRYAPRVIVVERLRHHHRKHLSRRAYRPVVVYYIDGRYYDRVVRRHPRMREVVVYEHHGRYYRGDRRYDRDD